MALRRRRTPWQRAARFDFRTLVAAIRDRRTPWRAKLLTIAVVAYALWPFDLVPDFAPLIGWIDDLIIVPLGLWLAYRMIPGEVVDDARRAGETRSGAR